MGRTACTEPQCLDKGALYCFTLVSEVIELVRIWNKAVVISVRMRDSSKQQKSLIFTVVIPTQIRTAPPEYKCETLRLHSCMKLKF